MRARRLTIVGIYQTNFSEYDNLFLLTDLCLVNRLNKWHPCLLYTSSVAFAYVGNTLLFAQEFSQTLNPPEVDASILLHASTFGWALLFLSLIHI